MGKPLFEITSENLKEAIEGLELLSLPPSFRRRLMGRMARLAMYQAVKNVADQKDINGQPFTLRAKLRNKLAHNRRITDYDKRPMLTKMVRPYWMAVLSDPDMGQVYFRKRMVKGHDEPLDQSYVAYKHQQGTSETFHRQKVDAMFKPEDTTPAQRGYWRNFCDEKQAKELIRCGFPMKKRPTSLKLMIEGIKKTVTVGHAYHYLKNLPQKWYIRTPSRPFLGASPELQRRWAQVLLQELNERFKIKNHQGLLQ